MSRTGVRWQLSWPKWRAGQAPRAGAFQQAMRAHIARMARYVPGQTDEVRQRTAVMLFSGMAGTLNVARALTDERRRRVLEDARTFYLKAVGG